jgi:rubrerythrin
MIFEAATPTGARRYPGAPWKPLDDRGLGYLSFYYSEPLARWPVRQITRPGDNKSDPNIETGTYGLFSTCEPPMRNRIVKDGAATIFFLTRRKPKQPRVLTGYYHIGWYTEGTQGAVNNDYALAASAVRFFDLIPTTELPAELAAVCGERFRTSKPIGADLTTALRGVCDAQPDLTTRYIEEVRRVERFARARSGFAYPSWARQEGFSWDNAKDYYPGGDTVAKVPNSSKTGKWRCSECGYIITSGALLKKCPLCEKNSTLKPAEDSA